MAFRFIAGAAALGALFLAMPQARADEIGNHIAAADTYVVTYAPRVDATNQPTGFYVERHYDFGLNRLTERFYGDGSVYIQTTPFDAFNQPDGSNYITGTIKPAACETAKNDFAGKSARVFLEKICGVQVREVNETADVKNIKDGKKK